MAYKGPSVPHRTGRSIAIEHGVDPKNLQGGTDESNWNAQGGHPKGPPFPAGSHEELRPMVDAGAPTPPHPTPFILGGK